MRSLRLMLAVTSISFICILCCSLVFALNPDEASVSMFWLNEIVYPGDTVSVRITLKSNYAEQLKIYYIGLHFDWMDPDGFYGSDLSDNPVIVPRYGTYIFDPIVFQIPLNVSAGSHSYFVGIDGTEGLSFSSFIWNSSSSTVQIHGFMEKIYHNLVPEVESKINEAISANYESAEAQSILQQAQYEYSLATITLADAERWNEAIERLYNATDLLEQADAAEQRSAEQEAEQQTLLFYLAIIAIVVIVVVSIIVVVLRKKRKETDSVVDQTRETIEEQS